MRNLLLLLLSSLVFVSCGRVLGKRINGNGSVTTDNRQASGFNAVAASSNVDVYVKTDSSYGVRVVTDANIQEYIYTDISGSTLRVGIKKGYRPKPTDGIRVYVAGPSINKFEASGACKIFTENQVTNSQEITIRLSGACDATMDLNSPEVKAELSGAGTLNLKGQAKTLSLRGTGSSTLKCADMMAENVKVNITGAGEADVFASVNLDVKVTGAGTVRYKGNPSVNQRVSGAGTVKKLN
jgi:hypothetical protein